MTEKNWKNGKEKKGEISGLLVALPVNPLNGNQLNSSNLFSFTEPSLVDFIPVSLFFYLIVNF